MNINQQSLSKQIFNSKNEAIAQISEAKTLTELEEIRIAYFGRSGKISNLIKEIKSLGSDEKKKVGILVNQTKNAISEMISNQKVSLTESAREWFDPTIPGTKQQLGSVHLITKAINEIADVFEKIGFSRSRYPEVEWDWFSFGSLNFPQDHPARDEWETFFVDTKPHPKYGQMLLTPHTSSGQVREMMRLNGKPPIRMINLAKCYRRQSDPAHSQMFHQFEGLVVDEDISISHLKGTLAFFARKYFGENRKTRLRPYDFLFTEPSFEVDITCDLCNGTGKLNNKSCKVCKEGWLELGGAGMVHPRVLVNGGISPKTHTGFAFGFGVERVLMMKSGLKIPDLRLLYSSDLRFLRQF